MGRKDHGKSQRGGSKKVPLGRNYSKKNPLPAPTGERRKTR